jgi:hypothetical protein
LLYIQYSKYKGKLTLKFLLQPFEFQFHIKMPAGSEVDQSIFKSHFKLFFSIQKRKKKKLREKKNVEKKKLREKKKCRKKKIERKKKIFYQI